MCSEPTMTAAAPPSTSPPHAESSAFPRMEYSSSDPCALTTYGAPVAAPTGPPRSTWLTKTKSAGRRSRIAAAFASTHASSSARVQSWTRFTS